MASIEQFGGWAKAWKWTKQGVSRLPTFIKFTISCVLSVWGYDTVHYHDSTIEPLVEAMTVRVETRIEQAELRLEQLNLEASGKLTLIEDSLREHSDDAQQLKTDFQDFAGRAIGRLQTLAENHKQMERELDAEHARVELRLGEVKTAAAETHRAALAAEKQSNKLWREVEGLPANVLAHDQRLIDFLDDQPFDQLRHEVLGATAEVSRSRDLVVLRGDEKKQVNFKILQHDKDTGKYSLRDYGVDFAVEQTTSPCGVRITVKAGHNLPQTLNKFCENKSRRLDHVPLTATLMYVKNNFMHKDLIVLAVVADSRAEPPVQNSGPARRAGGPEPDTAPGRLPTAISVVSRERP